MKEKCKGCNFTPLLLNEILACEEYYNYVDTTPPCYKSQQLKKGAGTVNKRLKSNSSGKGIVPGAEYHSSIRQRKFRDGPPIK